jgi:hypothetical protein
MVVYPFKINTLNIFHSPPYRTQSGSESRGWVMKIRFFVRLEEVVAETPEEAREKFAELLSSVPVQIVGYEQPDGSFEPYKPAPEGYEVLVLQSKYFGSHPEYGEGNIDFYFATPIGAAVPEIRLSHGHGSASGNWEEQLAVLPGGTLQWQDGWVLFEHPTGPGWDEPGEVGALPDTHRLLVLNPGEFASLGELKNRKYPRYLGIPLASNTRDQVLSFSGDVEVEVAFYFPLSLLEWVAGKWNRSPMAGIGCGFFSPATEYQDRWRQAMSAYNQARRDQVGGQDDPGALLGKVLEVLEVK